MLEQFTKIQYREEPLFPLQVYIYNLDGTYGQPVQINSEAQLNSMGTKLMLDVAMKAGREIRIVDSGDMCVFHAEHGQIIFPSREQVKAVLGR